MLRKCLAFVSLLAGLAASSAIAHAQATILATPAGNNPVFLAPLEDRAGAPMFATETAADDGVFFKADFALDFLQPIFADRSVRLAVPGAGAVLGDTGNLSYNVAFCPKITTAFPLFAPDFGVQASAQLLTLSGSDTRSGNELPGAGIGTAKASAGVDIATFTFIEGFKIVELGDLDFCHGSYLQDVIATFTVGGRLCHVRQTYNADIVVPAGQTSLGATQEFNGYGVTGSFGALYPCTERCSIYVNLRGSLYLGQNDRGSSITMNAGGVMSTAAQASDVRTELIPVGEFEFGVLYGFPLKHRGPAVTNGPLLWCRAGLVAEVWDDLGLLHINSPGAGRFSDSELLLVGFSIRIGLDY